MRLEFPAGFFFGTSTAAAQVETASDHNWKGVAAADGYVLNRTTDHEKHRHTDAELIARLGTVYRCGVDWARLQPAPMSTFEAGVVEEYQAFFHDLNRRGVNIMFVLHHFTHPLWLEEKGGWADPQNIPYFLNYAQQCILHFGPYVQYWNTFNEPNVYAMNAYLLGNFPPQKEGKYNLANKVLDNMGRAHDLAMMLIKEKFPDAPVGISLNTGYFKGANFPGKLVASFVDWWFHTRAAKPFRNCDFWGLSYYAYMLFDPFPIDALTRLAELEKRNLPHDKMWGYKPEGLGIILRRFYKKYRKPIIITENGICTDDAQVRIQSIRDYLNVCHQAIQDGVQLLGYIHWSTWDNFEWHLGPTYRFGLVRVDLETMERRMTDAGLFYENITKAHAVEMAP